MVDYFNNVVVCRVIGDLKRAVAIGQLKVVDRYAGQLADNLVNLGVDVLHACGHHDCAVVRLGNAGIRRSRLGILFIVKLKSESTGAVGIIGAGGGFNAAVIGENRAFVRVADRKLMIDSRHCCSVLGGIHLALGCGYDSVGAVLLGHICFAELEHGVDHA